MAHLDFISAVHKKTKRDYLGRVNEYPKAEATRIASKFGQEYWDGDRKVGYGGYRFIDGYWKPVAEALAKHYKLQPGAKVLDVGCGKAFLLYELSRIVPGLEISGIDISDYAIENAKEEVRPSLQVGNARELPYPSDEFDLVISINALHNLCCFDLEKALREIQRVGKQNKYIVVESYRNAEEKANLLYWQLTCEAFCTPDEWQWWFDLTGYDGDHAFIYFE